MQIKFVFRYFRFKIRELTHFQPLLILTEPHLFFSIVSLHQQKEIESGFNRIPQEHRDAVELFHKRF